MSYHLAEIFYSLQGEGHRKGSANIFVRFAGCNLQCNVAEHGFDCDTDFSRKMTFKTAEEVLHEAEMVSGDSVRAVIFTGGEPGLQLDDELVNTFKDAGWFVAVETNGMYVLPRTVDWISCSPKRGVPPEALLVGIVDEVRIVMDSGEVPDAKVNARHHFVSPAFDINTNAIAPGLLAKTIGMCKANPTWRLSLQDHKTWNVR